MTAVMVRSAARHPERRNSDPVIGWSYDDAVSWALARRSMTGLAHSRTRSVRRAAGLHCNGASVPHRRAGASWFPGGIAFAYVGIDNPYWLFGVRIHTIAMKIP